MNSFGLIFRVSLFGESHGPAIGVTIDGCPPGIAVKPDDFIADLKRRQSGSTGTTKRQETDRRNYKRDFQWFDNLCSNYFNHKKQ